MYYFKYQYEMLSIYLKVKLYYKYITNISKDIIDNLLEIFDITNMNMSTIYPQFV